MKPNQDSRREKKAAEDGRNDAKEVIPGGAQEGRNPGQPRSWKQYIEQTMPAQGQAVQDAARPEPKARRRKERGPAEAGRTAAGKMEGAGKVLAAKAQEGGRAAAAKAGEAARRAGKSALAAAEAAWEKVSLLTAEGWDRAGRATAQLRNVVARHPISPLLYVTVLAVGIGAWAFNGTYARAYVMEADGEEVALVANEDEGKAILSGVESRASDVLGEDFSYGAKVTFTPVYATPEAFSDTAEVEDTLFEGVGAYMEAYAISVDGVELGFAPDKDELYRMLDEIAQPYIPQADSISYEFVEDVQVYPVTLPANSQFDVEAIRTTLSELRVEQSVYVVEKGDTFNAIAYSLDMWPYELSVLNPDIIVDKLWVGQELIIQEAVPFLSVKAVTDETYEDVVPSPVEYIETAELYVGDTKVKEQGEDGLELVNAHVTYVNGVEVEREVLATETLKEATTTYSYTGTTPRPVTASNGYYIWPVRGRITSNFGGRNLWGRYDFHLGLDIACPMGTSIKAADGGTVIKAGWSGSYGNLVAIKHDNGTVTYYAHNSSLLVSVGQKVYQGQIIAKAGMTGNASGPHCHFEVRVNGTSVNPRNYLS